MIQTPAEQFDALWNTNYSIPNVFAFLEQHAGIEPEQKLAVLRIDQKHRWKTDQPLLVEDYLARLPDLGGGDNFKIELAVGEFQARQDGDSSPSVEEFLSRFSDISDTLRQKLSGSETSQTFISNEPFLTTTHSFEETQADQQIGRYRIVRLLGEGAFGRVFLAFDEELERQVAIKVPKPERFQSSDDAELYLSEARMVAALDHPNIVPVHDVGRTEEGAIYVVSKFVEGHDLKELIEKNRPSPDDVPELLAVVAQALHHAHQKRLIHRDVKPANILIEEATRIPYITDFGLAIKEEDYLKSGNLAGTPAYMSPEQIRGEGHRLDGRSDIFSLGIVLYELLTGKRPFRGSSSNELMVQISTSEPKSPRERNASLPSELERICLKALAKRASDRYPTAAELADDLLHWNQSPQKEARELQVVPKGLRSFDAKDSDFFLELLPGPQNREGLPESLAFWKSRIEETDAEKTFAVGMIYGPSGCGKSSLVKAGLLSRLNGNVVTVYVESTADDTETRILRGLRKQLPDLLDELGLVETFTQLRRGSSRKVVVVLDQFEQWLHAHKAEDNPPLVNALRQCDGEHLQAVVMVRDDFGMAATRFMDSLDIPLLQGHNFTTVDLFDVDHAEKVLIKFGQAFEKLPTQLDKLSNDEHDFVSAVAEGLAQDGKVVSVRLALFAEMVKGKPWTPTTLKEVGGTQGIGVNFLEETFSARTANPKHRQHQAAAREVLKCLLPEVGSDIKGHMRSHAELLEASGYSKRPKEFDELLRILDGELRLITPTDPDGVESDSGNDLDSKYYQLTHDYLVPALREWLTRKQRETKRGQVELRLSERNALWSAKPENRHLPSWLEWANIRLLTERSKWSKSETEMMKRAGRFHGIRGSLLLVMVCILAFAGLHVRGQFVEANNKERAAGLVTALTNAEIQQVPGIIEQLTPYQQLATPLLKLELDQQTEDSQARLNVSLALVAHDPTQVEYLSNRLINAEPDQVKTICLLLANHKEELVPEFWKLAQSTQANDKKQLLQVASALASYDPDNEVRWQKISDRVVEALVNENSLRLAAWIKTLRPVRRHLLKPLSMVYRNPDEERSQTQIDLATDILEDYAAENPPMLAELLLDAEPTQFVALFDKFAAHGDAALTILDQELAKETSPKASEDEKETVALRQANAAVALLRMGQTQKVWPLLKHSPDPRLRTWIIHLMSPLGVPPRLIFQRLEEESEVSIRRALILALGEYDNLSGEERNQIRPTILGWYKTDPDRGIHGATEWLLRRWDVNLPELSQGEPLSPQQMQRLAPYRKKIEELNQKLTVAESSLSERQAKWEKSLREISTRESLNEGLVVHFPFNNEDGLQTVNQAKEDEVASYEGTSQPKWVSGVKGNALLLDGKGSIRVDYEFNPARTDAFSYGCWFVAQPTQGRGTLISKHAKEESTEKGFALAVDMGKRGIFSEWSHKWPSDYKHVSVPDLVVADQWHHLFVTYDGTEDKIHIAVYLDGEQVAQKSTSMLKKSMQNSVPLRIGSRGSDFSFQGAIDEVRIYRRLLSSEEVRAIYLGDLSFAAEMSPNVRSAEQQRILASHYRRQDQLLQQLINDLAEAKKVYRDSWLKELAKPQEREDRNRQEWYINTQGQTFVILDADEFLMGSPDSESGRGPYEHQHKKKIGRRLAISIHEVTKAQWRAFSKANPGMWAADNPVLTKYFQTEDSPMTTMTWFEAAHYCNWLSEQEGIPPEQWCYETNAKGDYAEGMQAKDKFWELSGYRLPTEAEWEFVCRAETQTSRFYGSSKNLLPKYAWYLTNSNDHMWPVGSLKPNDFGLFDIQGNALEWCNAYEDYQTSSSSIQPDTPNTEKVDTNTHRALRGGSFLDLPGNVRSAKRTTNLPNIRYSFCGFRIFRSIMVSR